MIDDYNRGHASKHKRFDFARYILSSGVFTTHFRNLCRFRATINIRTTKFDFYIYKLYNNVQ